MRYWVAVSLLLFAVILGLACASGEDTNSTSTPDVGPPCTNEATVEAFRIDSRTRTTDIRLPDDEIQCRLRRAILTLGDLPDEWGPDRFSLGYEAPLAPCYLPIPGRIAHVKVGYELESDEFAGFVSHALVQVEEDHAEALMAAIRHGCGLLSERSVEEADGRSLFRVDDSIELGDDSIIVDEQPDQENKEWFARTVVELRGNTFSLLTVVSEGDLVNAEKLAGTLSDRLRETGALPEPTRGAGYVCDEEAEREVNDKGLESALISIEDLDEGWVEDSPNPCGFRSSSAFCSTTDPDQPEPKASARRWFLSGRSFGPQGSMERFAQGFTSFEGEGAEEHFAITVDRNQAASSCPASFDGDSFTWNFEPIESNSGGTDSEAWIASTEGLPDSRKLVWFVVSMRREDYVGWLVYAPPESPFPGEFQSSLNLERFDQLAAVLDEKLADLAD